MNEGPLFPENKVNAEDTRAVVEFLHVAHGADYYLVVGKSIDVIFGPGYHEWSSLQLGLVDNYRSPFLSDEHYRHLESLAALYR